MDAAKSIFRDMDKQEVRQAFLQQKGFLQEKEKNAIPTCSHDELQVWGKQRRENSL